MDNYRIVETKPRGYPAFYHVEKRFLRWFWRALKMDTSYDLICTYKSYQQAENALREYIKQPRTVRIFHTVKNLS